MTRHFLKASIPGSKWVEVSKKEWIEAERKAGFRPKMASDNPRYMDVYATGGFSDGGISGSIRYDGSDPNDDRGTRAQ